MKSSHSFKQLPLAVLVLSTLGMSAQAATTWTPTNTRAFSPATAQSLTAQAAVHGVAMQANEAMHIAVSLQLRNKKDLDGLTNDIMTGKSRAYLTKEQFLNRHAPTAAQVKAVTDHLAKNGFTNIKVAENNLMITADGSAGGVKSAFNTEVHHYSVAGRNARANVSDAMVPQELSGIVLAVHGLQDVHMKHTMAKRLDATTNGIHTLATGHNPKDFSNIYGASSLPAATNATLGIITQGSMTQTLTDLRSFASSAGFPAPSVTVITVGAASTDTSGVDEWNMDTQSSLSTAGGQVKSMLLYTSTTLNDADLNATLNKAVADNLAKSINVSLGECENDSKTSGSTATEDAIFQTAVAQGQMFSISSGDSGSAECGAGATGQSAPAVSPYVMAIGGTLLQTSGSTWSSETVWTGGGGGPSQTEPRPSWQASVPLLANATGRGVPDLSFDADPNSGALVLVKGVNSQIGGTSLAAPIFAGIWARIQSANGNALPFPASKLYATAAANPSMFHDITSGNNGGYTAAAGWDYATGFGSVIASNFASVIAGTTPPPPPPPGNVLTKGVAVTGITLATNASKTYTIAVPSGASNLTFNLSGGTGDGDIYTQFNSAPTTSSYLAKSDGATTTESITIAAPSAGTYYLLVNAYAAINNVSLVANYSTTAPPPPGNVLSNGVPVSGQALTAGTGKVFTITVPAGRPSLTIKTTGGTGDADIYTKLGAAPTTSSYLAKSDGTTSTETITINAPAAGTYYILLNAYATFSGVTITATY